jgi:uncharacterized protein
MNHDILSEVKKRILSIEPSAEVYLYGSRARHDNRAGSDWDFLVLVSGRVDRHRTDRIRRQLYEIEWETGEVLSSIVRSRQDWNSPRYKCIPLHQNIAREGILL